MRVATRACWSMEILRRRRQVCTRMDRAARPDSSSATMTGMDADPGRIEAVRQRLAETDADALWVHPSVDLRYLAGLELLSLERPTGLLIPRRGPLRLLVPLMLLPQAAGLEAEPVSWTDEAGPERALTAVLDGVRRLLVEPSLPTGAAFLMRACAPGLEIDLDPGIVAGLRERKSPPRWPR